MAFKVVSWKATHTSGTKFYQVVRIVNLAQNRSWAVQHSGGNNLFIGLGKVSTGRIVCEPLDLGLEAGNAKITEKRKGGYTQNTQTDEQIFGDKASILKWAKAHFGDAPMKSLREAFANDIAFATVEDALQKIAPKVKPVPDEPNHIKHPDWGTW